METVNNNKTIPDFVYKSLSKGLVKSVGNIEKELTQGFKFISDIKKGVAVFGSGRFAPDNPHYRQAQALAELLAQDGFTVITGGGPGIMEAANKGALKANGQSVGLNILIPGGQDYNAYVKKGIRLNYFFVRKVVFAAASRCYVFFPGGFGTLDEFFEIVNLIHNRKINRPPLLIAIGRDYWQPLFDWLKTVVYENHRAIEAKDFKIFHLVNSPTEASLIIKKHMAEIDITKNRI